jgi:hypothetical protein
MVPAKATFVQPFLRLKPPADPVAGPHLEVDNVRLISWAPTGRTGPSLDTVEATAPGAVTVVDDRVGAHSQDWLARP